MASLRLSCVVLVGALAACGTDESAAGAAGSAGSSEDASPAADASDEGAWPRPATMLGSRCSGDGDCGEGLFCSLPSSTDWAGGGPAHGYCTRDCSQDGDASCAAIDPESFCYGPLEGVRLCIQRCHPGGTEQDFDIMKCWARQDVACSPFVEKGALEGVWGCWPTCGDDTDCAASSCDRDTGACSAAQGGGLPLGSNCAEWASSEGDAGQRCQGYCTDWTATGEAADAGAQIHTCLARCVIGDPNACGFPKGLCTTSPGMAPSFGDLGYCVQTCETDDDCLDEQSGLFCDHQSIAGAGVCNWYGSATAPDAG